MTKHLSDGQVLVIRRHRAQVAESIDLHRRNGSSTGMAIAMVRLDTLDKLVSVTNSRRKFDLDGVQTGEVYGIAARIYTNAEYAEALRRNDLAKRIGQHIANGWRDLPTPTLEKLLAVLDAAADQ